MTVQRFDLFLTGELAPDQARDTALQQLATLFKRPVDQVAKLLNGKPNRVRKDLDAEQIQRYQQVFAKIGVIAVAKPIMDDATVNNTPATNQNLRLSPEGTPVLHEDERYVVNAKAPDTKHLSLAPCGETLAELNEAPPLPSPDIEHISLDPTGTNLGAIRPPEIELDLNALTADLSLSAAGTPLLSEKPQAQYAVPDTSHLSVK